jgi:hypothetical protein
MASWLPLRYGHVVLSDAPTGGQFQFPSHANLVNVPIQDVLADDLKPYVNKTALELNLAIGAALVGIGAMSVWRARSRWVLRLAFGAAIAAAFWPGYLVLYYSTGNGPPNGNYGSGTFLLFAGCLVAFAASTWSLIRSRWSGDR